MDEQREIKKRKSYRDSFGRPTSCTHEMTKRYCKNIPLLPDHRHLAAMVGMEPDTIWTWLKRDAREWMRLDRAGANAKPKPSEEPYLYFHGRVSEEFGKAGAYNNGLLLKRAPKYVLKKRFPYIYGDHVGQHLPPSMVVAPTAQPIQAEYVDAEFIEIGPLDQETDDNIVKLFFERDDIERAKQRGGLPAPARQ